MAAGWMPERATKLRAVTAGISPEKVLAISRNRLPSGDSERMGKTAMTGAMWTSAMAISMGRL